MTFDSPGAVDPTLAVLARLVTDTVGDHGRELIRPALTEMFRADAPRGVDDARVPAAIARAAAHAAHAYGFTAAVMLAPPPGRESAVMADMSEAEECGWWRRRLARRRLAQDRAGAQQVIEMAIAELTRLPAEESDIALAELLTLAVRATRDVAHPERAGSDPVSTGRSPMPCRAA